MSRYTTQVRYICEYYAGLEHSVGYDQIEDVLNTAWPKIFDYDFPIFDEAYRAHLCKLILLSYYQCEIAHEVVGVWKYRLKARMYQIMPKYNAMYKSIAAHDPFDNVDHVSNTKRDGTDNQTGNRTGNSTTKATGKSKNRYSDTPQGSIADLEADRYLTNANITDDTTNSQTDTTDDTQNDRKYNETVDASQKGKTNGSSYYEHYIKYAAQFESIDQMIVAELEPLFFGLWM